MPAFIIDYVNAERSFIEGRCDGEVQIGDVFSRVLFDDRFSQFLSEEEKKDIVREFETRLLVTWIESYGQSLNIATSGMAARLGVEGNLKSIKRFHILESPGG